MPSAPHLIVDDHRKMGIPEPELARVLELFYRLNESLSRETGGGLGLAIAQSIAQSHGGTLKLSNRPAGGLRATTAFLWPRQAAARSSVSTSWPSRSL
jgi:signal transduction histidine kinase